MKLAASKRWLIWLAALAATIWLVAQAPREEAETPQVAEAVSPRHAARSPTAVRQPHEAPAAALAWGYLAGRSAERGKEYDLFRPHKWYVPPPPQSAQPSPPPKPTAPPAPFAYLGKLEDAPMGTLIFLSANNKVYTVAVGDTIDRTWRVDSEDASSLHLTYVPLGLPQALSKSAKPAIVKPNENQGVPE